MVGMHLVNEDISYFYTLIKLRRPVIIVCENLPMPFLPDKEWYYSYYFTKPSSEKSGRIPRELISVYPVITRIRYKDNKYAYHSHPRELEISLSIHFSKLS